MTRPNIVLVTVDSLRADHCGFHGYDRETTPTLDRLADEGLVLENAIAPGPATPESMSVVHTGQFLRPYYTGNADVPIIHRRENVRSHLSNHLTIAEALSRDGYTTLGFSPNPFTSRPFGFQKGFDEYEDFLDSTSRGPTSSIYRRVFERFIGGDTRLTPIRLLLNWIQREEMFKSWDQYYEQVVDTVNRVEEPFFLWVFLLDTHLPYLVGAADRGGLSWLDMWRYNVRLYSSDPAFDDDELRELIDLYDATIRQVDTFIDRLQRDLEAYEPTLVFHSDHGEAFGEHGTFGHEPYVYEENIRVPFLVANGDPSGTVSRPVSLRSIPALIASLAGVESSFPNLGVVEQEPADDIVMSNPLGHRTAMRSRRLKFIRNSDEGRDEMYDLAADHDERSNLLEGRSELANACRAWLRGRQDHETEELELSRAIGNMIEREEL